jgi:hypothetical protein
MKFHTRSRKTAQPLAADASSLIENHDFGITSQIQDDGGQTMRTDDRRQISEGRRKQQKKLGGWEVGWQWAALFCDLPKGDCPDYVTRIMCPGCNHSFDVVNWMHMANG